MSFRLFIYYCALCSGWAALAGWFIGRIMTRDSRTGDDMSNLIAAQGIKGFFLGFFVSLALSSIDALWSLSSLWQAFSGLLRIVASVIVGSLGGMMGGYLGELLYDKVKSLGVFLVIGWMLTGLLIGVSVGVFDVLVRFARQEDLGGALRKVLNGTLGGTLGGLLGGLLQLFLRGTWSGVFSQKDPGKLWSPSSTGFVALGLCIGLLIGLAQVFLKEAWIKIEAGRRAGKEMLLTKKHFIIGRAEACDLGLFGDPTIEKKHARIIQTPQGYYLTDLDTPAGTYVNGQRITDDTPLRNGDIIRLGNSLLRFGERARRG